MDHIHFIAGLYLMNIWLKLALIAAVFTALPVIFLWLGWKYPPQHDINEIDHEFE